MTRRSPRDIVDLAMADIRYNGGRRLRGALRRRSHRLRRRLAQRLGRSVGVTYPVAFGPNGERTLAVLRAEFGASGVPLMFGGAPKSSSRTVHVDAASLDDFSRLLLALCPEQDLFVGTEEEGYEPLGLRTVHRHRRRGESFDVLVLERRIGGSPPHLQCSRIAVAVWSPGTGPYMTPYLESDREFAIVGRLSPSLKERLASAAHDFDHEFPAPDQPAFPIDVVYTWVDSEDPLWLEEKLRFRPDDHPRAGHVVHDERFRSRDELKYSLRSLDLFAPWVCKIHIVTADQCPLWLDTSHPKINLVSHRDIYRDPSWLPTFNSSGIETQLHHIPGLAQRFLYFNDDFLLGQLADPSDFFFSNGVLKFFPSEQRAYEPDIATTSEEYIQADRNAIELFKPIMSEVGRSIMRHVPYPSDRDLLMEMEDRWPEQFAACASSRFRSWRDLRPIAFMQYHYGYNSRRALPSLITHRYLALWKPKIIEQLVATEQRRAHKTICLNDVALDEERVPEVNEAVRAFLQSYYPSPSPFELAGTDG